MEHTTLTIAIGLISGALGAVMNAATLYRLVRPLMGELATPLRDAILAHRQDAASTAEQIKDHTIRLHDLEIQQRMLQQTIDEGFAEIKAMIAEIRVYIYQRKSHDD